MHNDSPHHPRTNNHRYNHRHNNNHHHKLHPQSPDPPTNSKSKNLNKKKNSKSSTKLQPNRSINEKTQPTIGGEIGKSKSNKISNPNKAEIQKQKKIPFFLVQSKQQNPDSVSSKRQI